MNETETPAVQGASCPIAQGASAFPDRIAVYANQQTATYEQLHRWVCATQAELVDLGIKPGSRVSLVAENSLELLVVTFALFRIGGLACLLNTRIPDSKLKEQLEVLNPLLHVSATDRNPVPSLTESVSLTSVANTSTVTASRAPNVSSVGPFRWNLSQPCSVIFTSGSTGVAKAVLHKLGNHYYSAIASSSAIPLSGTDVWLLSLPMYHVGGLAIPFRCFLSGCAVHIAQPRDAPSLLEDSAVTHASFVQAQLKRWLELGGRVGSSTKVVLLGGSALSPGLVKAAIERGLPVRLSYGLSEMSSQVATTTTNVSDATSAHCGPIVPYARLRIDRDGTILVSGQMRFMGYLTKDGVDRPFDKDGWFRTSDVGRFDGELLHVRGRTDNMFISGGENIHPEAIEDVIARLGGVREVVVVPVVDEEYGARPVAVVDSVGSDLTVSKLKAAVASVLPSYMVPVRVLPWPAGSKSDTVSKVDRKMIREYAETCLKDALR